MKFEFQPSKIPKFAPMLVFRIAFRYVLALRKFSTTQILSLLAFLGIFLGSMSMVIVLSAFNGFETLLKQIYHHQDPDLKIESLKGKTFKLDSSTIQKMARISGLKSVQSCLSDKASLQYGDGQMVVELVGVQPDFVSVSRMDSLVKKGDFLIQKGGNSFGLVSESVRNALQINLNNQFEFLELSYPKRKKLLKLGTSKIFNTLNLGIAGFIQIDEPRVYAPIESVRQIMDKEDGLSYLEIYTNQGSDLERIKAEIQKIIGKDFSIKNEIEQHADLFKILKIEKLFVFLALGFIILISSFNLFVSCSMLVIDKKKDLFTLMALGLKPEKVSGIIRYAGGIIAVLGLIPGLLLGFGFCLAQKWYGFVPLGMTSTLVEAYPIDIQAFDFILIAVWVAVIALAAVFNPSKKAPLLALNRNV